jgi:hypothetical protein
MFICFSNKYFYASSSKSMRILNYIHKYWNDENRILRNKQNSIDTVGNGLKLCV